MKKRRSSFILSFLFIVVLIVILKQNYLTTYEEVSINYIETGFEDIKFYELADIINDSVNDFNGYLTYQVNDNHRYIYKPIDKIKYLIPEKIKGSFINIIDDNLIAINYNNEQKQFIVQSWDFVKNKYEESKYTLEVPNTIEIIDIEYLEGSIFIAINDGKIIKINEGIQILEIPEELKHYYENNTLIVYNEQIYINADRDLIYQYNKQKKEFQKLSPSPTLVSNVGIFKVENRNTMEIITELGSSRLTLPAVPEDNSLHHESSYFLLDSLNHNYLVGRSFDNLYLNSNNEISVIPLNELLPLGSFIDKERLLYRKDNKLILLNIGTLKEEKLIDFAPTTLKRLSITESKAYFQFIRDNKLYILEFTTNKGR